MRSLVSVDSNGDASVATGDGVPIAVGIVASTAISDYGSTIIGAGYGSY